MKGWFRLHREILDWEHFTEPTVLLIWICLLACARTKAATVRGIHVEQNEAYVSFRDLHEYTGLSINTIKAAIEKLVATGEIEKRATRTGTIFKIVKFSHYQPSKGVSTSDTPIDTQSNTPIDTQQQPNKQIDSNKKHRKQTQKPLEKTEKAVTRYDFAFEEIFKQLTGDTFIWSKRENVAVNTIVGKIAKMMDEGGADSTNGDLKEENFRIFLTMLYERGDNWIRSNFVPHVIADKFIEYYQRIKNYGNGKQQNATGVSADYLASVIKDLNGNL